ncbi:hypothetical protein MRX96_057002 [Rhipicephalus microplus]
MRGLQSRRQRHCPRDLRVTSAVASKGESAKSNTSCLGSFLTRSTRFRYLPEVCDEPVLRAGGLLRGPACRGGDGAGCRGGLRGQLVETRQEMATLQASGMGAGRASAPVGLACSNDVDVGRTHGPGIPGIPPTVPGAARSYAAALAGSGHRALAQSRGPGGGSREPRPHVGITNTWRS